MHMTNQQFPDARESFSEPYVGGKVQSTVIVNKVKSCTTGLAPNPANIIKTSFITSQSILFQWFEG